MKLVVDTNRIMAALIKDSASRRILYSKTFEFVSAEYSKTEIKHYEKTILEKSELTQLDYNRLFEQLFDRITLFEKTEIKPFFWNAALETMKPIDETDTPFLALALQEQCAIWSDDKHFLQQKKAKVWTTGQLVKLL